MKRITPFFYLQFFPSFSIDFVHQTPQSNFQSDSMKYECFWVRFKYIFSSDQSERLHAIQCAVFYSHRMKKLLFLWLKLKRNGNDWKGMGGERWCHSKAFFESVEQITIPSLMIYWLLVGNVKNLRLPQCNFRTHACNGAHLITQYDMCAAGALPMKRYHVNTFLLWNL